MSKELHLIVTCAERKRVAPTKSTMMRSLRARTLDTRLRDWAERLRTNAAMSVAAEDLYAGEYWSIVRTLPSIAREAGFAPTLWVASAGYGLVRGTARIRAYAATFTAHHPDTVIKTNERADARRWWNLVTKQRLAGSRGSSDLQTLARKNPGAAFLIIGSPTYISAMHDDIAGAAAALDDTGQLVIVTSPNGMPNGLAAYTLYATAGLQSSLGGSLLSLHARVASALLQAARGQLDPHRLKRNLRRREKERTIPSREALSDKAVRQFIKKSSARNYSAGLRELRDAGFACEQSRFRQLFRDARQKR
jgi:hypothetical protein